MKRNGRHREDTGAALITVAITLLLLMGVAAVAIDGGLAYNQRRHTQGAADNAALAAAWAACHGEDPVAAGRAVAQENGFDSVDVEVTSEDGKQHVVISSTDSTTFGKTVGVDEMTVISEAVAECEKVAGTSPYVLFAGGPPACGENTLMLPAASKTINGGVHTNGGMNISGPLGTMFFNGHTTYVTEMPNWMENQYGSRFFAGHSQTTNQPYPVPADWVIENYAPGGSKATAAQAEDMYTHWPSGMNTNSAAIPEGLNYVQGNVNIYPAGGPHGSGNSLHNTTIVATGTMTISAAFNEASPYEDDGLLLFGNSGGTASCWNNGLQMSADLNSFEGTIYFPNGKIGINNDRMIGNGAIIGYTINLASSHFEINPYEGGSGAPSYRVELVE